MEITQTLSNIISVVIFIGGPIIPLLILAIKIGGWHNSNPEPTE